MKHGFKRFHINGKEYKYSVKRNGKTEYYSIWDGKYPFLIPAKFVETAYPESFVEYDSDYCGWIRPSYWQTAVIKKYFESYILPLYNLDPSLYIKVSNNLRMQVQQGK